MTLLDHELVTPKQMTEAEATEKVLDVAWPNKESQDENEDSENKGCSMMEREKATARLCCQK